VRIGEIFVSLCFYFGIGKIVVFFFSLLLVLRFDVHNKVLKQLRYET
jgi:hypothetical protein